MRMVFPQHVPGRFINELASDMNALFGTIIGEEAAASTFSAPMDITETETGYTLVLDVPGVSPDQIQIELEDGRVTIHGQRPSPADADEPTWRRVERTFGEFTRKFRLPKVVDQERIEAEYDNGVLTVQLPKLEKKAAKQIVINHSGEKSSADTAE